MAYRTFRNLWNSFPFLSIGPSFSLKALPLIKPYYVAGTGLGIISLNSHSNPMKQIELFFILQTRRLWFREVIGA